MGMTNLQEVGESPSGQVGGDQPAGDKEVPERPRVGISKLQEVSMSPSGQVWDV